MRYDVRLAKRRVSGFCFVLVFGTKVTRYTSFRQKH